MTLKGNPITFMYKKLWHYSAGNRPAVVLYTVLFFIANILTMLEPLIIAKVLNIIQLEGLNPDNMYTIIGWLFLGVVLWIGFWIFHGPARVLEIKNAFLCRANYKKHLVDGTLSLPPEWHTDHHSGDTIDKIEKGTNGLYEFAWHTFEIITNFVKLTFAYVILVYFNIHSAYIVLIIVVFTIWTILQFDKVLMKQYAELFRQENKIAEKIFDVISNITTVIILRVERLVSSAIYKRIMNPLHLFNKNNKLNETKWFTVSFFASLAVFFVMASYIYFNAATGTILTGTIYALFGYVSKITNIFFHFAYRYGDIVKWRTQVENAEEISDQFLNVKKVSSVRLDNWKELIIKNLNFSYDKKGEDLHLNNVSMTIRRKDRIALIGDSGSGKTTFLKLLRDMYRPKKLELYLDGVFVKHGFKAVSKDISLIPQDPEIFTSTIKDNITIGVSRTMKEIQKYTDMACFTSVANKLPHKFQSYIFEKGVNLSGGEKQRLALSRGLMASENKSIVLLDESTSSVDVKNEIKIYENIFRKFRDKTIVSSIHKLHLLPMFDTIYYFRNGKVIASGDFTSLKKESKAFARLLKKYDESRRHEKLDEVE